MKAAASAAVASAGGGTESLDGQTLYKETKDGWFIYVEDRSCVMYLDLAESSSMLRFSARVDENRMHFSVVNDGWEELVPMIGETVLVSINFPERKSGYSAAGW